MSVAPATGAAVEVTPGAGPVVITDPTLAGKKSVDDLKNLFSINIDNSIDPVTVGLERLAGKNVKLSGAQIAAELTNAINRAYGDEKPFNFDSTSGTTFSLQLPKKGSLPIGPKVDIVLQGKGNLRYEDLVAEVQDQINTNLALVNAGKPVDQHYGVTVSYDTKAQKLVFKPDGNDKISVMSDQTSIRPTNDPITQGVNDDTVGLALTPSVSAASFRASNDQRYGATVEYDAVKGGFVFKSGTTGDASSISLSNIKAGSLATVNDRGLGLTGDPATYAVGQSKVDALRGIASKPAVLSGNALAVNVDNNFAVDTTNNQFVVSVNGVTGTVVVPPKDTYTLSTFMEALQSGINNLQGPTVDGATPQTVDGVKVTYDTKTNSLKFTTGTASTSSYIKVTGDARWGLDGLDAKFGTTTTWIKPTPFKDEKNATVYIDGFGKESSTATGFDNLPEWSPVYFDKGELTFDTAGNLVSPKQGAQLDTVYLPNGKGSLTINIDYSKSTQFASPYAVLSQSQDGAPEGDLVGLAVKDDGLVNASYSNGAQKSLGKVVLVNFSNPTGLRQIGDTSYYKTSDSGTPKYGEAGSAGYGTVRSGATERANVDLTQELVDLITEQRNFQANAKAIETSTSLTSTIIQIRN
jgi:flagellar hook-basal body protein